MSCFVSPKEVCICNQVISKRDVRKDPLRKMPQISKFPEVFHLNYENAVLYSTVYDVIVPFPKLFCILANLNKNVARVFIDFVLHQNKTEICVYYYCWWKHLKSLLPIKWSIIYWRVLYAFWVPKSCLHISRKGTPVVKSNCWTVLLPWKAKFALRSFP